MPDVRPPTAEELEDRVAALERRRHEDEGLFVEKDGPALLKEVREMMDLVRDRWDEWLRALVWVFLNEIEAWLDGKRNCPSPRKYWCAYRAGTVLKIIFAYQEDTSLPASVRLDYDCHVEPDKRICSGVIGELNYGLSDEEWEGRLRLIRVLETRWKRCEKRMNQPPLWRSCRNDANYVLHIIEEYGYRWRPLYYSKVRGETLKCFGYERWKSFRVRNGERWKRIHVRMREFDRHAGKDLKLCHQILKDCEGEPPDEALQEHAETLRPIVERWRRCEELLGPHICGAQPSEP